LPIWPTRSTLIKLIFCPIIQSTTLYTLQKKVNGREWALRK